MLTRSQAVGFLLDRPLETAHLLGFDRLTEINGEWLKDMMPHKGAKDTSLQAHRLSYKTTCVSITLARIMLLLPSKRTLFVRKTDSDVKEILRQVQKILQNPRIQYLAQCIYGESIKLNVSNATELTTNLATGVRGTSQLVGTGIGSSLTGKHFDYIFTDDISNINDRISKAERDKTKLVYQELQNIKNRDGRIYNTLTPWHPDDVSSIMPEAKRYTCYETGLMSKEQIEEIQGKMLPSLFAANYELRFVAAEDVIFNTPKTGADVALVEQSNYCHIDAAYGGEDYTAFTVVQKKDGVYYVYGRMWHKHVDDVLPEIIGLHKALNAGKIYVENNGDKGYLAKALRAKGERAVTYHEDMNKYLKITSYLKAAWENVIFVAGTDESYIRQICDYTEHAEHDDAPDSLASIIRLLWRKKDSVDQTTLLW